MELIGMLDSPYVRRVAVTLHLLEQPFVHRPISVFSTFARSFRRSTRWSRRRRWCATTA